MITKRVIVISERGTLVGTQVLPQGEAPSSGRVQARLIAGPKQKIHEIQIAVPENHTRPENIVAWHKAVKKHLKLR